MGLGGLIKGASESISGVVRGAGAWRAGKKEEKGYRRAAELYKQLEGEAKITSRKADPFSQYREEAARRLYEITLGGGDFTTDPGYQFRFDEGQRATERAMSARGLGQSGNVLAALQERGQGLASQEYGNVFGRLMELGGGYASNAVAGANLYGQMMTTAKEGQAAAQVGKGFASARKIGSTYEFAAQSNEAAGRGVASMFGGDVGGGSGGGGGAGGSLTSMFSGFFGG